LKSTETLMQYKREKCLLYFSNFGSLKSTETDYKRRLHVYACYISAISAR